MERFPFLLRFGIHGSEAKWQRYKSFSFEAFPCDRDCISEDIFYLALLTLRNEINDVGKAAAIAKQWGWNIDNASELDALYSEFRTFFEENRIPVQAADAQEVSNSGSQLQTIETKEVPTEIFENQVEIAEGTINDKAKKLPIKNWAVPNSTEYILTNALWVRFVNTIGG